jgi:putative transposase
MEIDIIEPGYFYHIYNRGINKTRIFSEEDHYYRFLSFCKEYLPLEADVLAYCLLPNHFHFLLYIHTYPDGVNGPRRGNSAIGNMFNAYAQWYNKKIGRTGGLFQRPFKRKRITDDIYMKQVIYYIHRNPLHHRLIDNPENWLFSSYQAIIGNQPTIISRNKVLEWFENRSNFIDYHKMQFDLDSRMFEFE